MLESNESRREFERKVSNAKAWLHGGRQDAADAAVVEAEALAGGNRVGEALAAYGQAAMLQQAVAGGEAARQVARQEARVRRQAGLTSCAGGLAGRVSRLRAATAAH